MDLQNNFLLNTDFLQELSEYREREIFARVTLLSQNESPLEYIEGKITGGSINIDGTSAVRRTCNLTMVAADVNLQNFQWGLNSKFKLEIGIINSLKNKYPQYDDLLWFPEGVYIITSFNSSYSANNYTFSISGKDKMCLLNGEIGGTIPDPAIFSHEQYHDLDTDTYTDNLIPIKTIIRELVQNYGNEQAHNIIINDLDDDGLELLEYRGNETLYLLKDVNSSEYVNMTLNGKMECQKVDTLQPTYLENLIYDDLMDAEGAIPADKIYLQGDQSAQYTVARFNADTQYAIGYRLTDLTYAGELCSKPGDAVTTILDKIKQMLGFYEYFYDLDGHFVFQKKKDYTHIPWTPIQGQGFDSNVDMLASPTIFNFTNSTLITTFQNTPNLNNVRNDYSVWGHKKASDGKDYPIHMRYALDRKPASYVSPYQKIIYSFENNKNFPEDNLFSFLKEEKDDIAKWNEDKWHGQKWDSREWYNIIVSDWREIIYQMGRDYRRWYHSDNYLSAISISNPEYLNGNTGYEQYYTDLLSFWRELYNPNLEEQLKKEKNELEKLNTELDSLKEVLLEYEEKLKVAEEKKDTLMVDELNEIIANQKTNIAIKEENIKNKENKIKSMEKKMENFYTQEEDNSSWNKNIFIAPEKLNFWFDFLDTGLDQFSVPAIGTRSKAVNDNKVNAIYYKEVPNIIFTDPNENIEFREHKYGYSYIQLAPGMEGLFSISPQRKSAQEAVEELLYKHSYCIETVTINAIPVYFLQPNTMVEVSDNLSNIHGKYTISRITLPLTYNGTMSITATKAPEKIL